MANLLNRLFLIVGLAVAFAPLAGHFLTRPTLAQCKNMAVFSGGPAGRFPTYNAAANARCDGYWSTWSALKGVE